MQIIDAKKHFPRRVPARQRTLGSITTVVLHHDAGVAPPPDKVLARLKGYHAHHLAKGWGGLGYHYVIATDGSTYKCNSLTDITAHAKGGNTTGVGVMLMGNFDVPGGSGPTDAQLEALADMLGELRTHCPSISLLLPHRRVHGSATACPGRNWPDAQIRVLAARCGLSFPLPQPH